MKTTNGTVVLTVHAIRKKTVGILAVFFCIVTANQEVHGQCTPTYFGVNQTPTIIGTPGAVNTTYKRTAVTPGVDMVMQILSLNNGATLLSEDDAATATSGYNAAWQPVVVPAAAGNGDAGVTWRITFYETGTSTLHRFNCLSLLPVDIDGNGTSLREYVEVSNPYSFSGQSAGTFLTYNAISNVVRAQATAIDAITNIDSTQKQGMSLFRLKNVSSFTYTTGWSKTAAATANRQFSLFFNTATNFDAPFSRYFDTDGDNVGGINGSGDLDDDNDGIPDTAEYPSTYADPFGDADNDGLANYEDSSPGTPASGNAVPTWSDVNGDGVSDKYDIDLDGNINSLDLDSDNDGLPDIVETGGVDTNGDGLVDSFADTNGNGLADRYDPAVTNGVAIRILDSDGDGIPNFRDLDSDNDGIPDIVEAGGTDTNGDGRIDNFADIDDDGYCDLVDSDVGNQGGTNVISTKALLLTGNYTAANNPVPVSYPQGIANDDGRDLPNFIDLDSDDDGIADVTEAGGTDNLSGVYDGRLDYTGTFATADTDGDGFLDSVDGDVGNDGTAEGTAKALITTGADANNDGRPDSYPKNNADGTFRPNPYDADSDDDGIPDLIESGGVDANGGGRIDAPYTDANGNGWIDSYDPTTSGINLRILDANGIAAGGLVFDFDGDGIPNYLDLDSDNDGIADIIEQGGTDANNDGKVDYTGTYAANDLDNDGFIDVYDPVDNRISGTASSGKTPLITASGPVDATTKLPTIYSAGDNLDNATLINMLDLDADGDGLIDTRESGINVGTGITLDTNNDGVINSSDTNYTDANGDGWDDRIDALASFVLRNTDGIGNPNYLDIDSDDDGIVDNIEGQTTAGYIAPTGLDADFDGIDNAYDPTTTPGTTNNGFALADTDGDGTSDYRDSDSDNDGKTDRIEGWDTNGNGVIDGSEKAYVGTNDTDGDGLLDEYDAVTISASTIVTNATNNTTPASYPDLNNVGGNRDWREVAICAGNRLVNGSFELPLQTTLGNHVLPTGTLISGWRIGGTARPNIVRVDGSAYGGGPNNANEGNQYLDIADAGGTMSQIFEITCPSNIAFSGSFSSRNIPALTGVYVNWTGKIEILTMSGTVVATVATKEFTQADADLTGTDAIWYPVGGTATALPAGRYIFKATMGDGGNFDNAFLCVSACFKAQNADGDPLVNVDDIDSDNDGVTNLVENGGYDAYADADDDGIPNYTDATPGTGLPAFVDANNDGINDFYDSDKDGIINSEDLDSDNDGIADIVEAGGIDTDGNGTVDFTGTFASNDTNGDGLINTYDPTATGGVAMRNLDSDGDGIPNSRDLDSDNDGIADVIEAGGIDNNGDGRVDYTGTFASNDTDGDGLIDIVDGDVGNDGIAEGTAKALIVTSTGTSGVPTSYPRANADANGLPNPYDLDSDGDGIADIVEAGGIDSNGDGRVDTFVDLNNNGLADVYDPTATVPGTSIRNLDTDGDGIPNYKDLDSDNDGIADVTEAGGTDTNFDGKLDNTTDTDNDGLSDQVDGDVGNDGTAENTAGALIITSANGTNGAPASYPRANADANGLPNPYDLDSDDDGIPDLIEAGGIDSNGDGRIDATADANGNGWRDAYDPTNGGINLRTIDANGATAGGLVFDFDNDGIANYLDLDSDNDGIPDIIEQGGADTNNNGKADGTADVDGDGFLDMYDPTNNSNNVALGTPLITTGSVLNTFNYPTTYSTGDNQDGMGLINMLDLDADGDGITDVKEAGFAESGTTPGFAAGTIGANGWSTTVSGSTTGTLPLTNTDGRGGANYLDIDADDDGITDNVEGQATYSYKLPAGTDTDADGIDDSYDATSGIGGAGIVPVNTDNTDVADYLDLDSDNDNMSDLKEGWGDPAFVLTSAEQTADADGDGLLDKFDSFNMSSPDAAMLLAMQSNVTMKNMGTNGVVPNPLPTLFGSMDRIFKTATGPTADRDWRNITIILPVKLISFTASYSSKVATIGWTTANEDGHERYLLERSTDGVSFGTVTSATAKGTTTSNYTYADNAVPAAVNVVYYRLQMVNADGSISYSKVVAIRLNADKLNLSIYPNPVVDQVSISFASPTAQVVTVKVYSLQGAQVMTLVYKAQVGTNTLQLTNWSKLPAGDYLIEVGNDNFKLTHKLTHVH